MFAKVYDATCIYQETVPMLITLLVNYRKQWKQLRMVKCQFRKQAENILFHMAPSLITVMVCIS